jgi:hypothetical protein
MVRRDKITKQIVLYRPCGCDLEAMLETNDIISNELKSFFLRSKKSKQGEKFNLTKAYIFLTRLLWGEIAQRYYDEARHWVNLSVTNLTNVIGRGSCVQKVIKLLVALKIIEINHVYSARRFSKSYRFTDAWQGVKRERVPEPYYISPAMDSHLATQVKPRCQVNDDLEAWLLANLKKITLAEEVHEYIEGRSYRNADGLNYARHYVDAIEAFKGSEVQFSRAKRTGRVDTVITRMHRDVRSFLRYQGEPLFEVDMVASQPFLIGALLKDPAMQNERDEAARWYRMWDDGDFYEALRCYPQCSGISRDGIKAAIIKGGLNAQTPHRAPVAIRKSAKAVWLVIESEFPCLAHKIHFLKTVRNKNEFPVLEESEHGKEKVFSQFALKLHRQESSIIIDGACESLRSKSIFCYTIHDAIGCLECDIDEVKAAITTATEKVIGHKPRLDAKRPALQSLDIFK